VGTVVDSKQRSKMRGWNQNEEPGRSLCAQTSLTGAGAPLDLHKRLRGF
jgi:hypothetical protein